MHLTLRGVGHEYSPGRALFANLDVTFQAGRSYALVGPSGSGKSTLLAIVSGDLVPSSGSVERHGIGGISWVFQQPHGTPGRTALDHVALPFLARGASRADASAKAQTLLEEFGLAAVAHQRFRSLSGGESQRMCLARAIATDPSLILVDEPTAQLDAVTSAEVNASLSRLTRAGSIVVVATHDPGTRDACTDVVDLAALDPAPHR